LQENREKIVEAHIIDGGFTSDFYGQEVGRPTTVQILDPVH
jgi:hypothetical protein